MKSTHENEKTLKFVKLTLKLSLLFILRSKIIIMKLYMKYFKKFTTLACVSLLCVSCSTNTKEYHNMSLYEIYESAYKNMQNGDYKEAAEEFAEVEKQYQYSNWSSNALLMSAYCFYKAHMYADAIQNLKIFQNYHPAHEDIDYAIYMLATCNLVQISSSERSSDNSVEARENFRLLMRKFPQSKYYSEAKNKLVFLNNILANYEMNIGRFYQKKSNYIAAIPRFQNVISNYFYTILMPEAYYRIIESFIALGLPEIALEFKKQFNELEGNTWFQKADILLNKYTKHQNPFQQQQYKNSRLRASNNKKKVN